MGGDRLQSYSYLLWTPANDFIITEHTVGLRRAPGGARRRAETETRTPFLSWPQSPSQLLIDPLPLMEADIISNTIKGFI